MELVKLGRSGQISIPRSVLRRLGIEPETMMLVDVTADGGIVLRPAGVYPIEIYSDQRVTQFLKEDRPTAKERAKPASKRRRRA
jgi:AbrB family looped-hinge helix DNA binding protein